MREEYENDCPNYLRDFLIKYLSSAKGRTDRTVEAYYTDLRVFLRYLLIIHNNVPDGTDFNDISIANVPFDYISDFTLNDAYEYMSYLRYDRNNSESARSRKTSSLRQFFEYLQSRAFLLADNPLKNLEHPKNKQVLPKYLQLEQTTALLESIDGSNQIRDYCIITLFLNCGMRLSELAGLNLNDYSKSKAGSTLRLFGKGRKERIVYLNDACITALDNYIEIRPKSPIEKNAIFLSSHANHLTRLTTRRIQKIVEDQLKRAGLGNLGISVHKLRHTCATLMYEYGNVDVMVLKDILGHVNLATTEIYTHLSDNDRKRAAENSPLAKIKLNSSKKSSDDGEN